MLNPPAKAKFDFGSDFCEISLELSEQTRKKFIPRWLSVEMLSETGCFLQGRERQIYRRRQFVVNVIHIAEINKIHFREAVAEREREMVKLKESEEAGEYNEASDADPQSGGQYESM